MPSTDRAPSVQYYPRDWMSDPAVQSLSWDERGRFHWAWSCSLLTAQPGVASEDQWRRWMGYAETEWPAHREAHSACFRVRRDGSWIQERTVSGSKEQRKRYAASHAGADATNEKLSPEERSNNARKAAQVRWLNRDSAHEECAVQCAQMPAPASASASALKEESKDAEQVCSAGGESARSLIAGIVNGIGAKATPATGYDPRQVQAWLVAKGLPVGSREWYKLGQWLWTSGTRSMPEILNLCDQCLAIKPENPYAYFAPGGAARDVKTAQFHADRNEREGEQFKAEDRRFLQS